MASLYLAALLALHSGAQSAPIRAASEEICLLESSQRSGLNRICIYSCPSGEVAETTQGLCPLSIEH